MRALLLQNPKVAIAPLKRSVANWVPFSSKDFTEVLKLSANTRNLKLGRATHAYLITTNHSFGALNLFQTNSLINFYAKCGKLVIARKLFDSMRDRNVVSWGALMAGYFHGGVVTEVLKLFKTMVSEDGVQPNEYILSTVLSSCSDSGNADEGRQCHGYAFKYGFLFHLYVKNAVIDMYSGCFDVQGAVRVFFDVPGNDLFSYNSVMNGLLEHGYFKEALEVLGKMVSELVRWDSVTYVMVFGLCASLKDLKMGSQVHGQMLANDVEFDMFVGSAVINMYGKCGKIIDAGKVFNRLPSRNVVLWTAIMASYFQNGFYEEALNLFPEMQLQDVPPNEFTFAVLLNSAAGLSTLRHGYLLHACAEKSGYKDHINVGNALINMYSKGGNVKAANKVFSGMIYRDTISWNAVICGYAHHGLGKEALFVFQHMLAAQESPNYVTFVGVLSACSHLGLVQEGFYYLNHLMKQFGIEPELEHYTCIVGLLGKAGCLGEAHNLLRSTPVKWDVVAWRTLLNACHIHRNYGLGKQVGKSVLEMDPSDVGTYVLLSNMYAKEKRWDGVVKIRKLMREKNIKKEPGVSWIEIRNVTHVFVSDDNKHPESSQINEKVVDLLAMIKPLGYAPDIASVLHDVEDEAKEGYLSYHSEKLAIAYGLMKMPSEAPIYIIKNLRICDDCHSAVKLISKVTERVIVVRDTNRFHHFQNGCCSCADYW
ncbi:pentatricopeptide repeat-containing protein [Tripterygium wilfordii]|uniref:Pentatricopeptide repeat-containing protein n=1 Tax=Tripterygium wilfordii TaxID=458696 RepID=A0A7J7DRQ7_TRIWF|nr:pentatricopeptide repeat-containing protein At5g39680 [Tripterygium wilfordii]XP_038700021.1 pentatricopeptide repeat-containing protein At5g39680 [Tripterygium wilfordii]XP_038700022.1 pentatricopeptide repeat-containing protein At5g39680 [Tripterygium wilfordii]XP_038700023.1 pentatricopeptide repeat-containing protein At5g39680 [Tripterygium wilfordii]KAF5748987.1 pentatricopeptide repeat-containing protein [Tripterygium wilfordii]